MRSTGSLVKTPAEMHQLMAETLDQVIERVTSIQSAAREARQAREARETKRVGGTEDVGEPKNVEEDGETARPRWPMIVFRSPKGWTGPKTVDGLPTEGTWRSHQVPMGEVRTNPDHLGAARIVDAQLQARGAIRRKGRPGHGAVDPATQGRSSDERQPTCQRRFVAKGSGLARLSGVWRCLWINQARLFQKPPGYSAGSSGT